MLAATLALVKWGYRGVLLLELAVYPLDVRMHEALTGYMILARFHGWLELAMLSFLFVHRSAGVSRG